MPDLILNEVLEKILPLLAVQTWINTMSILLKSWEEDLHLKFDRIFNRELQMMLQEENTQLMSPGLSTIAWDYLADNDQASAMAAADFVNNTGKLPLAFLRFMCVSY